MVSPMLSDRPGWRGRVAGKDPSAHVLSLELVGQYQVGIVQQALVRRHDVLLHVQLTVVTHDRVEYCEAWTDPREKVGDQIASVTA